ncbi:hypothetical protein DERP_012150 [Dermatophagoides pteronyssinus]|uniref:Uncharacterized protein n=1 Tax=Dermatophagoides pteronyssinus TaxID=6956 RepID=A0ABQ8J2E2_DERPT|nr:hypothetical protein DERP_012150 [Dermatophagoides pteronyssinus]
MNLICRNSKQQHLTLILVKIIANNWKSDIIILYNKRRIHVHHNYFFKRNFIFRENMTRAYQIT